MKLSYDRHRIDLSIFAPKLRQCKARKKAKHKGCGLWKLDNPDNFIKSSGICRECKREIDRKRKHAKENRFLNIDIRDVVKVPLTKRY